MKHEPALDGLRGVAVAVVVAFHAGATWMVGGYLGVSLFFTLSGFLITSLLLTEGDRTGSVDVRAFWARRARRLLPASMATLLAVSALAPVLATPEQLADLRGDVWAALLYVANWRFIVDGQSYGDLFASPSPVLHFWSLAIEEQLYVVFPLLVALLGPVRRRLAPVLCGLVLLSLGLAWHLYTPGGSTSAAYYGTFTRGGELFVGALLAVVVTAGRHVRYERWTRWGALVALPLLAVLWSTVRQDSTWLYRGGLLVHALLCAVVILAAIQARGPVRAALALSPLRALGRISYGVYLIHWPILLWWDAPLVLQLGLAVVLASLSYAWFEQPIRLQRWRLPVVAVPAAGVLVGVVLVASTLDPPRPESFELALAPSSAVGDDAPRRPASETGDRLPATVKPYVAPPPPPRVGVFGDSTALRTSFGLTGWGWATGRIDVRADGTRMGCPLGRGGLLDGVDARIALEPSCAEWPTEWEQLVLDERIDVAVVQIGPWDVTDRQVDGRWTHIGEPSYDDWLRSEIELAVDTLSAGGARVVWLTAPYIEFGRLVEGLPRDHPISDHDRMDRLNELLRQVDAERDEMVVLDLQEHLRQLPGGEMDRALRPDGTHFSEAASIDLAPWLGESLIELARQV